jgi:ParB-like chromosome segregation protein Spo0J
LPGPIIIRNGEIIDGENRYKVCIKLGIEPKTRELEPGISHL